MLHTTEDGSDQACVIIADRHALFRRGLTGVLMAAKPDWQLDEASGLDVLIAGLEAAEATIAIVDLDLPGLTEAGGIAFLRGTFPNVIFVAVADSDDRDLILACLADGAQGYILRSATPKQFLQAMETILAGGVFAPASLTGTRVMTSVQAPRTGTDTAFSLSQLTGRQRDVFELLAEGCATKTIARRLDLAVGTVKVHLAAIYRSLGASSRLEALAKAQRDYAIG
ncbi:MAG TPA: response regulator transcription factor [Acetobacteraceae bacterium]|nr:response regulator transcription factor [Acetobacteraceae bacterium]